MGLVRNKVTVTVYRWSSNVEPHEGVRLKVVSSEGKLVTEVSMSMSDFGRIVTGAYVDSLEAKVNKSGSPGGFRIPDTEHLTDEMVESMEESIRAYWLEQD